MGFRMNKKCENFIPLFLLLLAPGIAHAQSPAFFTQEPIDEKGYISELDRMLHQRQDLRKKHRETVNAINHKIAQTTETYKKAVKAENDVDERCEDLNRKSDDNCPNLKQSASNAVMYAKRSIEAAKDDVADADKNFHADYDSLEAPMVKYRRALSAMNSTSKWAQGPLTEVKKELAQTKTLLAAEVCKKNDAECELKEAKKKSQAAIDAAVQKMKDQLKTANSQIADLKRQLRTTSLKLKNCQNNPTDGKAHVSNATVDQKAESARASDPIEALTPSTATLNQPSEVNTIPAVITLPQAAPKAK